MSIETLERAFGIAIGIAMPGELTLFGLSFWIPGLQQRFGIVAQQETSVAGFLFLIAGSIALGVIASGIGASLYDRGKNAPPAHNVSARLSKEAVYQNLLSQHYYYYLCYRNTSVAVVLAAGLYLTAVRGSLVQWGIGAVVVLAFVYVLNWAARDA